MRKIGFYGFYLLIAVFVFIKCTDNNRITNTEEKTFADFKQTLASDPIFNKVLDSSANLVEFTIDPETHISTDFDMKIFQAKMSNKETSGSDLDEMKKNLSEFTNRPDKMIDLIKQKYNHQQEFIEQNPGFLKLSNEQQKELIEEAISINSSNKKGKVNYYSGPNDCEDELAIKKRGCFDQGMAGSALCGLSAPTLLGAFACGAVVTWAVDRCYKNADQAYLVCERTEEK